MNIIIATDVRVARNNENYYLHNAFGSILQRYYNAFGPVILYARINEIDTVESTLIDMTKCIKKLIPVDYSQLFMSNRTRKLSEAIEYADLVILRAPSFASIITQRICRKQGCRYLAEAMGDAWDMFWNHGTKGKFLAPFMTVMTKKVFREADYALYVTEHYLEKKYPCRCEYINASNVNIPIPSLTVLEAKQLHYETKQTGKVILMTTGAVDVKYKGQEFVIRAMRLLKEKGIETKYYVVGGGDNTYLKRIAQREKVLDSIEFTGEVTKQEVLGLLDKIDIYIQPSLQEGLPRSVIEAMSRGCICIGAKTAGIPELLEDSFIVRRKNAFDIVNIVEKYTSFTKAEKCEIARRNFLEAKKYYPDVLDERRIAFFSKISKEI